MGAVDPTYPLCPMACILAAIGVFCVLLTSLVRHNWNLGVTYLCFWLFIENLAGATNSIVWSDNAEIKWYVYCDIVSHIGVFAHTVKPLATLIIMRRLYLIVSFRSEDFSKNTRRWNLWVEWTLGLVLPVLVTGPIYYIHQGARFQVVEGFGCSDVIVGSILEDITMESWVIVPPLASIIIYYPKVARTFYRQSRDLRHFLHSNDSAISTTHLRILALASCDILFTLPAGIVNIVLSGKSYLARDELPFYWGWTDVHSNWGPVSESYATLRAGGPSVIGQIYFTYWTSPFLAFAIFGLFGLKKEARASYWGLIVAVCRLFGWKPAPSRRNAPSALETMRFEGGAHGVSLDAEMGYLSFVVEPEAEKHHKRGSEKTGDRSETDSTSSVVVRHENA